MFCHQLVPLVRWAVSLAKSRPKVTENSWVSWEPCRAPPQSVMPHGAPSTNAPSTSTAATKKPAPAPKGAYRTVTRPLTLDAQTIEGKAESPRVLFVHMGPNIALEDAPKRPSYLRDDFTAALSSPVRLVVRPYPPLVLTPASGGNR